MTLFHRPIQAGLRRNNAHSSRRPSCVPLTGPLAMFMLAGSASLLGACMPDEGAKEQSVVSRSQLQAAERELNDSSLLIKAIPFGYSKDGCYARALIMSAKIAAVGIPSSSVFAFAQKEPLVLKNPDGSVTQWGYHAAPAFYNTDNPASGALVIDPSVNDERATPTPVDNWLQKFDGNKPSVELILTPGSCYGPGATQERRDCFAKSLIKTEPVSRQMGGLVRTVQEMPSFRMSDINKACKVLSEYSTRTPQKANSKTSPQEELSMTIGTLVRGLERQGLLLRDATFDCLVTTKDFGGYAPRTEDFSNEGDGLSLPNATPPSSHEPSGETSID